MQYANAAEILPDELLKEVQRYFPDGLLWVPKGGFDHKERADLAVKLIEKGAPVKEVAELAKMSPRHVRRLVKKHAEKTGADNI